MSQDWNPSELGFHLGLCITGSTDVAGIQFSYCLFRCVVCLYYVLLLLVGYLVGDEPGPVSITCLLASSGELPFQRQ